MSECPPNLSIAKPGYFNLVAMMPAVSTELLDVAIVSAGMLHHLHNFVLSGF